MDFYKRLNYSLGNEDWHVEKQALRVKPGDKAICVTASGDRPLHLLMTECESILSIDMNPIQNHLLALKLISLSQFDYEKYLAFLGANPCPHRLDIFNEIKSHLDSDALQYWEKNLKMIKKGILYQGKVERLTNLLSKFFKFLRSKKIETLLSFDDLETQREYLEREWDTFALREAFEITLNSNVLKFFINDPGLNSNVDSSIHPGRYIYQRMNQYLKRNLAKKSPLLQLVLIGKILPDAYFPYLKEEGYHKIRQNMSRLSYRTDNIIEFLKKQSQNEIDVYSMSDIASYMPQEAFEKLLESICHSAKPKARFCLREFMTRREIPAALKPHFKRNFSLEKKLEREESNFIYRFFAGEIQK